MLALVLISCPCASLLVPDGINHALDLGWDKRCYRYRLWHEPTCDSECQCHGSGFRTRQNYWDSAPEGALPGAYTEALVAAMDLEEIQRAWTGWFMSDEDTSQAATDWLINYLETH